MSAPEISFEAALDLLTKAWYSDNINLRYNKSSKLGTELFIELNCNAGDFHIRFIDNNRLEIKIPKVDVLLGQTIFSYKHSKINMFKQSYSRMNYHFIKARLVYNELNEQIEQQKLKEIKDLENKILQTYRR